MPARRFYETTFFDYLASRRRNNHPRKQKQAAVWQPAPFMAVLPLSALAEPAHVALHAALGVLELRAAVRARAHEALAAVAAAHRLHLLAAVTRHRTHHHRLLRPRRLVR